MQSLASLLNQLITLCLAVIIERKSKMPVIPWMTAGVRDSSEKPSAKGENLWHIARPNAQNGFLRIA